MPMRAMMRGAREAVRLRGRMRGPLRPSWSPPPTLRVTREAIREIGEFARRVTGAGAGAISAA